MTKLSLIFPMAGFGTRFGENQFKPFLRIEEKRFIEAALAQFLEWRARLNRIVFVCLEQHDEQFGVSKWVKENYGIFPVKIVALTALTVFLHWSHYYKFA